MILNKNSKQKDKHTSDEYFSYLEILLGLYRGRSKCVALNSTSHFALVSRYLGFVVIVIITV